MSIRASARSRWLLICGALVAFSTSALAREVSVGQTFDIAEPDTIQEIRSAAERTDWVTWMRKAPKDYSAFDSMDLPRNKKEASSMFDPTYTLPNDIVDDRGRVLAKAGTKVNPLAKVRLPGRYIVISPTLEDYQWLDEVAKPQAMDMVLIANGNVLVEREATTRELFAIDQRFAERFGIKGVPSIVEQEGHALRVDAYVVR